MMEVKLLIWRGFFLGCGSCLLFSLGRAGGGMEWDGGGLGVMIRVVGVVVGVSSLSVACLPVPLSLVFSLVCSLSFSVSVSRLLPFSFSPSLMDGSLFLVLP